MKSMNQRQTRVAEEVRHIAAAALVGGNLGGEDLARITVTDVWVSTDLRQARLYIAMPQDWDEAETLAALNEGIAGPLRKQLAAKLATKYIPGVTFMATENES